MNCSKPFTKDGSAYGCGQCVPCRINKRRLWTHRMMLEAALHGDNCFVTLTYETERLPDDLSVSPKEISLFVKRLRKRGNKFRYFACGEYGDNLFRPHYHLALFGFPGCSFGITRKQAYCCPACEEIRTTWGKGQILLGTLEPKSMQYISGYVTKRMTKHSDPRLEGRLPEFARMSLKPGLGHGMMHEVASTIMEYELDNKIVDVPTSLRHGRIRMPLGTYLRRNLRKMIGRSPDTPKEAIDEYKTTLQPMREAAFNNSESFQSALLEKSLGKRIQIEARAKRHKKVTRL